MQVYFLDNEDFFKRKSVFEDDQGKSFEDNEDRMIFFCKGAIETVKKFGWAPDIVHCHGWMTSLVPLYLKTAYKNDPIFQNSKVVYSIYNNSLEGTFTDDFVDKASINNLEAEDLTDYLKGDGITLHKGACVFSDAIIKGSEELSVALEKALQGLDKPTLEFKGEEDYLSAYLEFYNSVLEQEV